MSHDDPQYDLPAGQAFLISLKALIADGRHLLVLRRPEGSWDLPGGLLEIGEPLQEGLLREVSEETGLTVEIGPILVAWDHWADGFRLRNGRVVDARTIGLAYMCTVASGEVSLSHEHDDHAWASETELRKLPFSAGCGTAVDSYLAHVTQG